MKNSSFLGTNNCLTTTNAKVLKSVSTSMLIPGFQNVKSDDDFDDKNSSSANKKPLSARNKKNNKTM